LANDRAPGDPDHGPLRARPNRMICIACQSELAESALSCPQCLRLIHMVELEDFATRARAAWRIGNFAEERALWEQSLKLLPESTVQYRSIAARIEEIDQLAAAAASHGGGWKKASKLGVGPMVALILTKGKFLLLGLTKLGTLLSMAASIGVYWAIYGWALAAGLVFSIYIHEMGHVAAIRRYGFPASAPMFIPGFGAFIQLRGARVPPIPDARIGLAGPLYGLGAALAAYAAFLVTQAPVWAVIAHFGAQINLFNLIPVWQLDGSRGFHALTRQERGIVLGATVVLALLTGGTLLWLIALGATYRMFTKDWETEPDRQGLLQFLGLLAAFSIVIALTAHPAAIPAR
jgi:Zn-dependent protease